VTQVYCDHGSQSAESHAKQ